MHRRADSPFVRILRPPRLNGIILAIFALVIFYLLRFALIPFALAGALALVATPLVEPLARKMPRPLAGTLVFVVLLALLGGLGYWLAIVVEPAARDLNRDAPQLFRALIHRLTGADHARFMDADVDAQSLTNSASGAIRNLFGGPAQALAIAAGAAMGAFLTLLLTLFFLLSGAQLAAGALKLLPPNRRPATAALAARLRPMLMRYLIGVITISITMGTLSYIAFGPCIGLPHATMIAIATAVLETIPVIGPIAAAALVGVIAISTGSTAIVIGVVVGALLLRLLIDQLLAPIIFGKAVSLHPAVVLLALIVGATLYGILGVLLAVPVAAAIRIALQMQYGESTTE
jgi:predicted PurR-regulated permease PerM